MSILVISISVISTLYIYNIKLLTLANTNNKLNLIKKEI